MCPIDIFLCMLDTTVMNVTLPAIQSSLSVHLDKLSWALNIYTILFTTLTITLSKLAERWGINQTYIIGLLIFISGSMISARKGVIAALVITPSRSGLLFRSRYWRLCYSIFVLAMDFYYYYHFVFFPDHSLLWTDMTWNSLKRTLGLFMFSFKHAHFVRFHFKSGARTCMGWHSETINGTADAFWQSKIYECVRYYCYCLHQSLFSCRDRHLTYLLHQNSK